MKRKKDRGRNFLLLRTSYFAGRHRSTAKSKSESIDGSWTCREDFGIERNQSFKADQGNAQFSLCCSSTAMPNDVRKIDIRHFVCTEKSDQESRNPRRILFLNPGNVPCGKLPSPVLLDQCVGELHDMVERLPFRSPFHARFAEYNGNVIAVKPD